MAASFNRPHCGARVGKYMGTAHTVTCQYCGTMVEAPPESGRRLSSAKPRPGGGNTLRSFSTLTVGVPTCLGLFGAILGMGGSIFAVVLPFILRIFIQ